MQTTRHKKDEEGEGITLHQSCPWQAQDIVCDESSGALEIELKILVPKPSISADYISILRQISEK
jgi:hypothetical protein